MQPWYISGFTDGEGTFHVALQQSPENRFGWRLIPEFHISQGCSRAPILKRIQKALGGVGYCKANHPGSSRDTTQVFVVRNRKELLNNIIPFFERYPLQTDKQKDFRIFAQIVRLMDKNVHTTKHGFRRVVTMALTMNQGGKYRKLTKKDIFVR